MKAFILAGGKGTRLGTLTKTLPKPLVRISGKTILEYQIEFLRKYSIKEIVILINYLGQTIKNYLESGKKWDIVLSYLEEKQPLGTAGGIKKIEEDLRDDFLVLYGDLLINIDLGRLIKQHAKNKQSNDRCIGTVVVHPNNHPADSDLIEIDKDNKIIQFLSKPHPKNLLYKNLVNAACYILSPKISRYIPQNQASDFGKNIFPAIIKNNAHVLYGYNTPEYIKDIGTPKRLREAKQDIKSGWYKENTLKSKKIAIFLDRDGVINKEVDQLCRIENFELIKGSAKAIKKLNENRFYVVVVTNQPMVAKGFCNYNDILKIHKKMETELGKLGAKIDRIYFCPHHPEKGFHGENQTFKRPCTCRKPAIGMIRQAVNDLNIDLKKSYLVGDSTTDAQTAQNAGISFIGLHTGYGCTDTKYPVRIPSGSIKKNLLEATNYIIKKGGGQYDYI